MQPQTKRNPTTTPWKRSTIGQDIILHYERVNCVSAQISIILGSYLVTR